jgi:hypothetical protein
MDPEESPKAQVSNHSSDEPWLLEGFKVAVVNHPGVSVPLLAGAMAAFTSLTIDIQQFAAEIWLASDLDIPTSFVPAATRVSAVGRGVLLVFLLGLALLFAALVSGMYKRSRLAMLVFALLGVGGVVWLYGGMGAGLAFTVTYVPILATVAVVVAGGWVLKRVSKLIRRLPEPRRLIATVGAMATAGGGLITAWVLIIAMLEFARTSGLNPLEDAWLVPGTGGTDHPVLVLFDATSGSAIHRPLERIEEGVFAACGTATRVADPDVTYEWISELGKLDRFYDCD